MQALVEILSDQAWHGFIVFLRVAAMASLLPAFGEETVPARIKLGVALAFTLIVAPAVSHSAPAPGLPALALLVLTEALAGLVLGIGIRLFILALQTAGAIAAQSTSLSQILGGAVRDPLAAIGYILIVGALALAVMAGLHIKAAELVILSYDIMPIGVFAGASDLSDWGLDQIRRAFSLAFTLAAPFILVSVLYNLALGAINKAMPQLMVAFVGAPVITAGGLMILCISSPLILTVWLEALDAFMAAPFQAVP